MFQISIIVALLSIYFIKGNVESVFIGIGIVGLVLIVMEILVATFLNSEEDE
jgi:hypothetical protein